MTRPPAVASRTARFASGFSHGHPTRPDPARPRRQLRRRDRSSPSSWPAACAERVHINRLRENPHTPAAVSDPGHPRRLHLRRRRRRRQDPAIQLAPLPRRRPPRSSATARSSSSASATASRPCSRPACSCRRTRTARSPPWPTTRPASSRTAGFTCRPRPGKCPFLKGIDRLHVPIAHGEGQLRLPRGVDPEGLGAGRPGRAPLRRCGRASRRATRSTPTARRTTSPASATRRAACSGLMPHPERHVLPTQHPRWTRDGLAPEGDGLALFRNAVRHFA